MSQEQATNPGVASTATPVRVHHTASMSAYDVQQLIERNAALEENTLHVQAELRKREEELVRAGKMLEEVAQANAAMADKVLKLQSEVATWKTQSNHWANQVADREDRIAELTKAKLAMFAEHEAAAAQVDRDYDRWVCRAQKAEADATRLNVENKKLIGHNERLRKALLEQANAHATILTAVLG